MSSMVRRMLGAASIGALLLIACGESEKRSGGDRPARTGSAALDDVINGYCGALRSCCRAAGMSLDALDDCEENLASIEQFRAVIAGTVILREPERTQCVAEFREMARTCVVPDDLACRRIYDGALGEGASCEMPEQCRTGSAGATCVSVDNEDTGSGPGVCRSLTPGAVGSICLHDVDQDHFQIGLGTNEANAPIGVCDIRDGLYCDTYTEPYTCQQRIAAGQSCMGDLDECVDGYYCEVGICTPQRNAGAACENFEQCARDLRCIDGTCVVPTLSETDGCEGDFG